MSKENWDVNKYREEHESEEQWQLRKAFMVKWKDAYPEERLVCLARVFTNIEFLGCRYPVEVMQEVARLSGDIAKDYRNIKKTKLQRTFVSASDAAVDRARGVKREGGVIRDMPPTKCKNIDFVRQGQYDTIPDSQENGTETSPCTQETKPETNISNPQQNILETKSQAKRKKNYDKCDEDIVDKGHSVQYLTEMTQVQCLDVRLFNESMFETEYGKFVLMIRPWSTMICNIMSSCRVCRIHYKQDFTCKSFSIIMNNEVVATARAESKLEAKGLAERILWDKLRHQAVSLLVKDKWMSEGPSRISMDDMARKQYQFGTPIEESVAIKMMKLMGWKGGGLGADSQGIEEPIRPNFQMVKRGGLGAQASKSVHELRRAGTALMERFLASGSLDVDLVFSEEFSSEERAVLHKCASRVGLASKSHGHKDTERFLVVSKKLNPFDLVRAVVAQGGETAKYRVFLPAALVRNRQRLGGGSY